MTTPNETIGSRLSFVTAPSIRATTVGQVTERLTRRFPRSSPRHVSEVVAEEYDLLEGHPIRIYVPNLIEHEGRDRLRQSAIVPPAAAADA